MVLGTARLAIGLLGEGAGRVLAFTALVAVVVLGVLSGAVALGRIAGS